MKKIINFRPTLFIALSLIAGIVIAQSLIMERVAFAIIILSLYIISDGAFFILSIKAKNKSRLIFSLVFLLFTVLGYFSCTTYVNDYKKDDFGGHYYAVNGRITEIKERDAYVELIVDDLNLKGVNGGECNYKISLVVYNGGNFEIGDNVVFTTLLEDKTLTYEGRFNSTQILNKIRYSAQLNAEDVYVLDNEKTVFESVNLAMKNQLSKGMSSETWPIAYAMLTGTTTDMDEVVLEGFRNSGIAHIFAVSGLHIGFLATALHFILNRLKVKNLTKTAIVLLICLFYSGVCGFTASSIRATIMCATLGFSGLKGDKYDGLSSTALACIIVLLINPLNLFGVGFILSFSVVLGIIIFSPILKKRFAFLPDKISSGVSTALSAELISLPISIGFFGQGSLLAVMFNLLLIPIVSVLFTLILIATLIGGIFGIGNIVFFPLNYCFMALVWFIRLFEGNTLLISGVTLGISILFYYLTALILSGIINVNKLLKRVSIIVLCALFITCAVVNNLPNDYVTVTACGSKNISATLITKRSESILIISGVEKTYSVNRLKRMSSKSGINHVDRVVVLKGENDFDLHDLATRINQAFSFSELYYYGNERIGEEKVIESSFLNVSCYALKDGEINTYGLSFNYVLEGNCIEVDAGKKIAVFSKMGESSANYVGLKGEYDLIVTENYCENVYSLYKPKEFLSYRYTVDFPEAERQGNLSIILK